MTSFFKPFDCADDMCLLSHWVMGFEQQALDLEKEASRVGLEINPNKIEAISLTDHHTLPICINGQSILFADQFVYLERVVSANYDTFASLFNIWKSSYDNTKIKLRLTCASVLCCYMGEAHGK